MRRRELLMMTWWLTGMLSLGCAAGSGTRRPVSYKTSAKENFEKGKKEFDDENYLEAEEFFKFVKNKFPYSSYATDSDLLMADCYFKRDKFIEAAEAYADFIKLHPRHRKVPYAMFQIGNCFYHRIPDDWWFAPPAYELDQAETERAVRELQRYLERFPQDEHVPKATELLTKCRERLADREHYVMEFYHKRGWPRAVLWRANNLLGQFPGLGYDEKALFYKGQSHLELGEPGAAKAAWVKLLAKYPTSKYARKAKALLEDLTDKPQAIPTGGSP